MNRYIQQFINENEDLIDNDEWDTIYAKLWSLFGPSTVSEFTQVVTEAGIYPIQKLTNIPYGYRFNDLSLQVEIIPDNITEIKDSAYGWCSKLHTLEFDCNKCTTIHKGAFEFCELLDSVVIPGCVTSIRSDAFAGCTNLRSLKLEEGVQSIEARAFLGTKLEKVELPRSLMMLGRAVFPPTCTVRIYKGSDIEQVVNSYKYKVEYIV